MRFCTWSERRRPSAWTTFWRWPGVSAPLPSRPAACDPLSLVLSSLISGFYSLPVTRARPALSAPTPLGSRMQVVGQSRRRPVRPPHGIRIPRRQVREQLAVAGLAQLLADGADRGLDHRVAVPP